MTPDGPTYSYMGVVIPDNLVDIFNGFLSQYLKLPVDKAHFQPFLKATLKNTVKMHGLKDQKKYMTAQVKAHMAQVKREASANVQ